MIATVSAHEKHARRTPRLGVVGINALRIVAIVAIVAIIRAIRDSIGRIVMEPFAEWSVDFVVMFCTASLIGGSILVAVAVVVRRIPQSSTRQYAAVFAAIIAAAACARATVWGWDAWFDPPTPDADHAFYLLFIFLPDVAYYSTLGMLIAVTWLYLRADAERAATLKRVALDTARLDEQTAQAHLQMLEAQIEPHFLFNTLAHVRRLYEINPSSGAHMLRNLKVYLSIALPQMREAEATLERETAYVVTYLEIQQIRMGRRLAFDVAVPPTLGRARVPRLMLLTLVENAVKHGIAPARRGGRIDVSAKEIDGRLRIDVADTGCGFAQSKGGGTGLANIRARLRALFGHAASLSLSHNSPAGMVATLELPLETASDSTIRS